MYTACCRLFVVAALLFGLIACSSGSEPTAARPNADEPVIEPVWFDKADGLRAKGEYMDLGQNDRLYFRYSPLADSGVEVERVTDGRVVWRVHAESLGVIHSIYRQNVEIDIGNQKEGRFLISSFASGGNIFEWRDLETGAFIDRKIENTGGYPRGARPINTLPGRTLDAADGQSTRGLYLELNGGDRIDLRYDLHADTGVELERISGGKVVWRVHAKPLGVAHSEYHHEVDAFARADTLRISSKGSSGKFFEERDLKTGKLINREEEVEPGLKK